MLQTKLAPASPMLRPYLWAYCMTTGQVDSAPLVVPLPARPKQLLAFSLGDPYCIHHPESGRRDATPRVAVVGPQTHALPGLSIYGRIDHFAILFQPSGFNRLFGVPMTELTNSAYDAYGVIGSKIPNLEHELADTPGFADRIRIIERHFIRMLAALETPDPVSIAANCLFASNGIQRVAAMAAQSGLSRRQFERRFLAQVGIHPKLYARIIRFNAALNHKLQWRSDAWSRIANDRGFYDQMHLVRDCRAFTGEAPSRLLARLDGWPNFHALFATESRSNHE
ncbi:MAG TPA: helix-turn-helix domain-containing protein [Terriglobales bacterium]|nr:helix-turn-helix domain-containing protein [Terriglobales bacterium]